jgi:hypothetical protein|tara:strand:- start:1559 stop:1834 length:276 start_codon:yes stop_codon:yes gene_type:complete
MNNITTNNQRREYIYEYDVPQETLDWYDWLDEADKAYGWIHYKNHWYHISDFMRSTHFDGWHGYHSIGFSFHILIRINEDDDTYTIGTYNG